MSPIQAFVIGSVGGFIGYLLILKRNFSLIGKAGKKSKKEMVLSHYLLFGLLVSVLSGGFYTMWVIGPIDEKQAFLSGLTAEGFLIGYIKTRNK